MFVVHITVFFSSLILSVPPIPQIILQFIKFNLFLLQIKEIVYFLVIILWGRNWGHGNVINVWMPNESLDSDLQPLLCFLHFCIFFWFQVFI